ncbi:MAG TPA: PHB depolymerase family esterase [Gemmatimonadales bacterium]|jgi:polyhydroxybutyrate depolymerase
MLIALTMLGSVPRSAAAQSAPAARARTLTVDGIERSYLLYVPTGYHASHPAALVIVFHGAGGYPRQMARATKFTLLAEREGFVVAYPAGLGRRWNDGRRLVPSDDVGFIRALIDTLGRELSLDSGRIYATGISNGAMFSYRLACDLPGVLAGIAPVAGAMPAALTTQCAHVPPVAVAAFQGTEDRLVPYSGGNVASRRGEVLSATASVELWAGIAGCTGEPTVTPEADRVTDGTRVRLSTWSGCRESRDVELYTIEGGGHTWPGGPGWARALGRVTRDLDATTTIWSFFASHPKP